jgi:hemerythrin
MEPNSIVTTGSQEVGEGNVQLATRLESLLESIRGGSYRQEVGRTLAFLEEYVRTQLESEERRMREASYPDLAGHLRQHLELARDVMALGKEHRRDGASPGLVLRVSARAREWFDQHVLRADRELDRFLSRSP